MKKPTVEETTGIKCDKDKTFYTVVSCIFSYTQENLEENLEVNKKLKRISKPASKHF